MLHNSSITGKLLLGHLDNLLEVILRAEALHRGQGLPAVSLLDPDVDKALVPWPSVILSGGVLERIVSLEVLNAGHDALDIL